MTNLKLWSSTDSTFNSGSDSQVGLTVAADTGDGSSITFNSFSSSVSTGGTYYFLTTDISSDETGSVQGIIVQNSSFTLSNGSLSGTISNSVLSSESSPLPVELTSFTASTTNNKVTLNWQTVTEMNNYGFEIERRAIKGEQQTVNKWQKIGFLQGSGTSNAQKEYSYSDVTVTTGSYVYQVPEQFVLDQNYPNPFNPNATIAYQLKSINHLTLKVFDVLGKETATLVNEIQQPGYKSVKFDASALPSDIYFYCLKSGSFTQTKKLLLLK